MLFFCNTGARLHARSLWPERLPLILHWSAACRILRSYAYPLNYDFLYCRDKHKDKRTEGYAVWYP